MTSEHGQCRNLVRALLSWVLPIPATQPYAVRPPHTHGATDYGGYRFGGPTVFAAMSYEHVRNAAGRPWRLNSGNARLVAEIWTGPGRPDDQSAAQEVARDTPTTRTRSYAHCVLEDMGAKDAFVGPETGCATCYARRHFLNMSALNRIMLIKSFCLFCKFEKIHVTILT